MAKITQRNKVMKFYIVIIFLFDFIDFYSQNLIINGSFEKSKYNQTHISNFELKGVNGWYQPSQGTPDFFVSGTNFFGNQIAHVGKKYLGFYLHSESDKYCEYIAQELDNKLTKGEKYLISFYLSLSDNSDIAISSIGIAFTSEKKYYKTKKRLKLNSVNYEGDSVIKSNNWMKINLYYVATGLETNLIIGNFKDYKKYKVEKIANRPPKNFAYYYIDDVTIYSIKDTIKKAKLTLDTVKVKVDTVKSVSQYDEALASSIILKDINFETDKSELLSSSYKELDELVHYLKQNPLFKIEVNGYTDNTGKETDNLKLSEERAKTVVNYLIQKGIDEKRTTYKGNGSNNPIAPNDTEVNKAKNRRVEFKLTKQKP